MFSVIIIICDHKLISFDEKLDSLLKIFQMNTLLDNPVDNANNNYNKHLIHRDTILNMIESALIGLINLYTNSNTSTATNTITNINNESDTNTNTNTSMISNSVPHINTKHITNAIVDSIYVKTDFVYDGLKPTTQVVISW